MKIPVEPPFDKHWKHAYIVTNKEKRKMVCLVNDRVDRTTISLARYRLVVKLGRMLRDDEQVDHIDNDKTNDSIDNLQILTPDANREKYQETIQHDIHGTTSMYAKGCRCNACKKWKSDYIKSYYERHPDAVVRRNQRRREKRCNKKLTANMDQ